MPIESRFNSGHVFKRKAPVLDGGGQPTLDELGHKAVAETTVATLDGLIQPLTDREISLQNQAGARVSTHNGYFLPNVLITADCWIEYEGSHYEIEGITDPGGTGRLTALSLRKVS
jgi:uncharacterized lipoprotein NlpE involved in copper resistance